jgi:hypothetical protein
MANQGSRCKEIQSAGCVGGYSTRVRAGRCHFRPARRRPRMSEVATRPGACRGISAIRRRRGLASMTSPRWASRCTGDEARTKTWGGKVDSVHESQARSQSGMGIRSVKAGRAHTPGLIGRRGACAPTSPAPCMTFAFPCQPGQVLGLGVVCRPQSIGSDSALQVDVQHVPDFTAFPTRWRSVVTSRRRLLPKSTTHGKE